MQHDGVYTGPVMPQEPQPQELETVRRAAVLVIAALTYPRMVVFTSNTHTTGREYMTQAVGDDAAQVHEQQEQAQASMRRVHERKDTFTELDQAAPGLAFDAAELFVAEAERRGYDPGTIMAMATAAGL